MEEENRSGKLPPGFRFHPTDEELITHYLKSKTSNPSFTGKAIADVDLNRSEPWDLPGKAKMGEKEWYFFSLRDRKYPTGVRTNRATSAGYWKTTGKDKEIFSSTTSELVGMKKTLVFYKGRAPRGEKTNWVIHEYRNQTAKSSFKNSKDEWVVCRVFQKSCSVKKYSSNHSRMGNPYNADLFASASVAPSMIHQQKDPYHLGVARNHYMGNADFAELTRVLRGGGGDINHCPMMTNNLPVPVPNPVQAQQQHQQNFTASSVNLNLSAQRLVSAPFAMQPQFPGESPSLASAMNAVGSGAVGLSGSSFVNGGHEMNQGHARHGRQQAMERCMDQLGGYWPAY